MVVIVFFGLLALSASYSPALHPAEKLATSPVQTLRYYFLLLRLLRVLALRILVVRLFSPGAVFSVQIIFNMFLFADVQGKLLSTDRLYRLFHLRLHVLVEVTKAHASLAVFANLVV